MRLQPSITTTKLTTNLRIKSIKQVIPGLPEFHFIRKKQFVTGLAIEYALITINQEPRVHPMFAQQSLHIHPVKFDPGTYRRAGCRLCIRISEVVEP